MPISTQRVFVPLDGSELADCIGHSVAEELKKQQAFRPHLTYPCVKWAFEVKLDVHPVEPPEMKAEAAGEVVIDPSALAVTVVKGERNVDTRDPNGQAPDDAREAAGLPMPHVKQTPMGKVDAFDVALKEKAKGRK
jgi:hypothetical protein